MARADEALYQRQAPPRIGGLAGRVEPLAACEHVFVSYVELHCHSAYSFLDGASHPVELAGAAAEQGHDALALTDHDGLHGAMEMAQALRALGVRPITGAELTLDDGTHLTLLCETRDGLHEPLPADHGRPLAHPALGARGLDRAGARRPRRQAARPGPARRAAERHARGDRAARRGARLPVGLRARRRGGRRGSRRATTPARPRSRGGCCGPSGRSASGSSSSAPSPATTGAATGSSPSSPSGSGCRAWPPATSTRTPATACALQDAMVAVRLGQTLDESEPRRRGNSSHVLAPPERMAERFREHPDAVAETVRLAERLELRPHRGPRLPLPGLGGRDGRPQAGGAVPLAHATSATAAGELRRGGAPGSTRSCAVIRHLGLSGFFLLHRDLLELAREVAAEVRGPESARRLLPPGRGRGSSVSSIVCYLTGLSHVDPVENELFLGRFLNEELTALPDIDLDFPRDIREVLIPRVHDRYGRDRSALVAAFATYQARSAVRDFAKALGLPPGEIERLARAVDPWKPRNDIEGDVPRGGSPRWQRARAAGPRRLEPAAPPVPAPGRDGHLDPAADRPLPGPAGVDGGAPDGAVGQGLVRRRRLPQDRPARPGDALGGRALRGRDRAHARRADRPLAHLLRRPRGLLADPGGRDDGRLPDREPRADADARAHAPGEPRRPHRPGGARAARADPGRRRAPLHRAPQARCARTRRTRCPTSTRRSSRCCATRSARSSSRTR